jgi:hypothetical protein
MKPCISEQAKISTLSPQVLSPKQLEIPVSLRVKRTGLPLFSENWAAKRVVQLGRGFYHPRGAQKSLGRRRVFDGKKKNRIDVTVCIAAICQDITIICASDRMLTSSDIEFEPQKSKLVRLTSSSICMIAGDSGVQDEILQRVNSDIAIKIQGHPEEWLTISEIVDMYIQHYLEIKRETTERAILSPLNLTLDSFIARQKQMDYQIIRDLMEDLVNFEMPETEAIITGLDDIGPHIYAIRNGELDCRDRIGFASIGVGRRHADSEFMFAGHYGSRLFSETLMLIYFAKKRAEVAPGVGTGTDLYFIGPKLGQAFSPAESEDIYSQLDTLYEKIRGEINNSKASANKALDEYFQSKIAPPLQNPPQNQAKH